MTNASAGPVTGGPLGQKRAESGGTAPPAGVGEVRARDLELAALYQGGATLQEIGDAVGLTRERVRQRISRVRRPSELRSRSSKIDPLKLLQVYDESKTVGQIAREVGAKYYTTYWMLRRMHLPTRKHKGPMYSDDDLLKRLRNLATSLGRTPTVADLTTAAGISSQSTYHTRFGSYSYACRLAGLTPRNPGRPLSGKERTS